MGQTDSQFKAFLRFVLDALKDAETEQDEKKRTEKMKRSLIIFKRRSKTD